MRNFTLIFMALFASTLLSAQGTPDVWKSIDEMQINLSDDSQVGNLPHHYHTFELDLAAMGQRLALAPVKNADAPGKPLEIDIPLADGQLMTFLLEESSVMMPGLAAKFPQIKSYQGVGKDDPEYTIRLDFNQLGLFTRMRTPQGLMHVMPYAMNQTQYYMSFFRRDYIVDEGSDKSCSVGGGKIDPENPIDAMAIAPNLDNIEPYLVSKLAGNVIHRTYRMSIAAVAEHTIEVGGVANVMARIASAVNTLNEIYERELATSFVLVDNNDLVIQTDPANQPYTDVANSGGLLQQNHDALVDILGVDGFDIGHVFTIACTDGNLGIARLRSLCDDNSKGAGVTCGYTSDILLMVSETMAHEVGHQFGATHTWNNCGAGNIDNWEQITAYEPGSGTTIMSYAGVCGPQNVQFRNDTYFHVGSLIQMKNFLSGAGGTCAGDGTVDNDVPEVTHGYSNGFYIPISTPFTLTASATDPNDDEIFYCWEQLNKFPVQTPLGVQEGTSPSFRSFPPTEEATRTFPKMLSILTNNTFNLDDEILPSYSRNLKFRCSVRDDVTGATGVAWTNEISFEATDEAGPFRVTSPNAGGENLEVGDLVEVTWDVANTDGNLVNCQKVDILLSTNNGFDFDYTLVEGVPNNGSRMVVVPNAETTNGRILIRAADNIFFDISDEKFNIVPPSTAGFLFDAGPYFQRSCLPEDITINLTTDSLMGYNSELTFTVDGLPMGAVANITPNPALPSEDVSMTIDMSSFTTSGSMTLTITATGDNLPPSSREVNVDYIANDFSALAITQPMEGETGVAEVPTFSWTDVQSVDSYTIEVATSPAFGSTIIEKQSGITTNSYSPSAILNKSTIYYWRVTPMNICGSGDPTPISTFQTETLNCNLFNSGDVDEIIPAQSNNTISSVLNIGGSGEIIDVNVANVDINYSPINALKIELESPGSDKILLFDGNCGNTSIIDIGFDNEAPNPIASTCPPVGGVAAPIGDLSTLYGSTAAGDWTLIVTTLTSGFGAGRLNEWSMEICSNASVDGPSLIRNEELPVRTNDAQWISNLFLKATDPNTSSLDLVYTLVEGLAHGQLERNNGTVLQVGDTFVQDDIDNKRIKYVHDGSAAATDGFYFTINDGEGGYIGKTLFNIGIDSNNEPLSTTTPLDVAWNIFPNPAQDQISLQLGQSAEETLDIRVMNVQGQLIDSDRLLKGARGLQLNSTQWPVGIYFVEIGNGQAISTQKVIIQRR